MNECFFTPLFDPGDRSNTGFFPNTFGFDGPAVYEPVGHFEGDKYVHNYIPFPRPWLAQQSLPSNVPHQNPETPANSADPDADAIIAELETGL
jgi:hypothetical protein